MVRNWLNNVFLRQPIWLTNALQAWLNRRLPASEKMILSHRSIFILPSGFGMLWLGLVLLLYLFGTNYQNNLIIGLSLLLASLFNTSLIFGYRNLAGLSLHRQEPAHVYAGETLSFPCQLSNKNISHQVSLHFKGKSKKKTAGSITALRVDEKAITVSIPFHYPVRGKINPGRMTIESRFPLGLCRAWSHVDLDNAHIVFAKHEPCKIQLDAHSLDAAADSEQGKTVSGVDEFKGLKQHIRGESLKQVAWKQLAQGRGMLSKEFQQPLGAPLWLILDGNLTLDIETRISQLSWQIDKLAQKGQNYGLKIPGLTIDPDCSESHRIKCHQAIALLPSAFDKSPHNKGTKDKNPRNKSAKGNPNGR